MMKRKAMLSLFVIFLAAAIIGGATMAWFTAKADAPENVFQAGTVMLDVGDEEIWGADIGNINPGDCVLKCIEIENTGTKNMELRLVDVGFVVEFDWEWLWNNWEALCFTGINSNGWDAEFEWLNNRKGEPFNADPYYIETSAAFAAFKNYVESQENPAFLAPCPDSDWVMKYVKESEEIVGFEFYYAGGPIAPGESVNLCVLVVFDGEMMGNIWQGAEWKQINGQFQAVQTTNNAPYEVWGAGWDDYFDLGTGEALRQGTSGPYARYFYGDNYDDFRFEECCDLPDDDSNDTD